MKQVVPSILLLLASSSVMATPAIEKKLQEIIPGAPPAKIKKSVIPDLYEVAVGSKILYMSADAKYVVSGNIIDLKNRENLTETAASKIRKVALAKIDVKSMIVYPADGKPKKVITIFSDIDCPYCRKMHKEIPELNASGIEVRYLAYPRAGIGSPSYNKAVSAWCADDPAKAMDDAMLYGKVNPKKCDNNPVVDHMKEAQFFGVNGTPNIVLESGELIPGYVPAKELLGMLMKK